MTYDLEFAQIDAYAAVVGYNASWLPGAITLKGTYATSNSFKIAGESGEPGRVITFPAGTDQTNTTTFGYTLANFTSVIYGAVQVNYTDYLEVYLENIATAEVFLARPPIGGISTSVYAGAYITDELGGRYTSGDRVYSDSGSGLSPRQVRRSGNNTLRFKGMGYLLEKDTHVVRYDLGIGSTVPSNQRPPRAELKGVSLPPLFENRTPTLNRPLLLDCDVNTVGSAVSASAYVYFESDRMFTVKPSTIDGVTAVRDPIYFYQENSVKFTASVPVVESMLSEDFYNFKLIANSNDARYGRNHSYASDIPVRCYIKAPTVINCVFRLPDGSTVVNPENFSVSYRLEAQPIGYIASKNFILEKTGPHKFTVLEPPTGYLLDTNAVLSKDIFKSTQSHNLTYKVVPDPDYVPPVPEPEIPEGDDLMDQWLSYQVAGESWFYPF